MPAVIAQGQVEVALIASSTAEMEADHPEAGCRLLDCLHQAPFDALVLVCRQDGDVAERGCRISGPVTAEGEGGADDLAVEFGDRQERPVVVKPAGQIQEALILGQGRGAPGAEELEGTGQLPG